MKRAEYARNAAVLTPTKRGGSGIAMIVEKNGDTGVALFNKRRKCHIEM